MPPAKAKKAVSLAAHAAAMRSKYGEERISNGPAPVVVPSGSVALDWALRVGGFQLGRVYEIIGPPGAGKSTLAIAAMIEHARMFPDRGYCYLNMESTFDPKRATRMGLDCSDAALAEGRWAPMLPEHSEHVSDMARDQVGSGLMSIVTVDSIGAMESDRTLGKTAEKAADAVGRNAKIITQMTKALATMARLNQCTVLLVNQPRAPVGSMMSRDVSSGPKLVQHATTAKIEMQPLGGEENVRTLTLPDEDDPQLVSIKTRLRVPRLKTGLPGRVGESYVNRIGTDLYGPPGFDQADELITLANRRGIVERGGAWYTLPNGDKFQGRDAFAAAIRSDEGIRKMLRDAIPFEKATFDDLEEEQ